MTTPPEEVVAYQKREQRRTGMVLIAVALVLGACLGFMYRTDQQAQVATQRTSTLEQQVVANGKQAQEAKAGVEEANRRLRAAGRPTVPVPTVSPVSPPSADDEVDLTVEQVRALVVAEVADHKPSLTSAEINQIARVAATFVPKPKDGRTPTATELQPLVAVAVTTYCGEDRCAGDAGPKGDTGNKGDKGEPGRDAPKVTDEQLRPLIATSLVSYCSQDSKPCEGKVGDQGPPGKQGEPGRGIVSGPTCVGTGSESYWLTKYTDDTEQRQDGPCRFAALPPEPSPSASQR